MAEIDPELRDKLIETHTLVKRMDLEHNDHKKVVDARIKETNKKLDDHQKEVKLTFEKHDSRIEEGEHFRTKVIAYAAVVAAGGAVLIEILMLGGKKIMGVL